MSTAVVSDNSINETPEHGPPGFLGLFLFSLLLASFPVKNIAYLLPPLYLLAQLVWFDTAAAVRALVVLIVASVVSAVSVLIDGVRGQVTNVPGVFMGMLTFLPLFIMVGERIDKTIDEALFQRMIRVVSWFVLVQSAIGAVQFAASGNADAVAGTLGLFDFRTGGITIAQLYFGFLMLGMVLFLMTEPSSWIAKAAIVSGLSIAVLSQSGHQCVFFIVTLAGFTLLQSRRIGWMLGVGVLTAALVGLVFLLYPNTLNNTRQWYQKTLHDPHSPKRLSVDAARDILSNPKNLLLGTGMGQFSSRAALITSDEMLAVSLPSILVGRSDYYKRYLVRGLHDFEEHGEGSAVSKPYFSWLSVVVEFGPVLTLVLLAVVLLNLGRCLGMMWLQTGQVSRTGMLGAVGLVFLLLCSMVENYAEFPQAIFVPYLLYLAGVSRAQCQLSSQSPSPPALGTE